MTAPSGRARIRIDATVDPELGAAIDRTMRRAQEAVDRRMRGIQDSSQRAGDAMGREFDAAYRRMEQGANRVNAARAREEAAIARITQAQRRMSQQANADHATRVRNLDQLRAAEQAAADAAARRRDAERDYERSRRDVVEIDSRLNDGDAVRGMARLRLRLQAMANRPIRQDVEVVARGMATVLKLAAGVTAATTAIGGLGLAAGAAIIPVAALAASLSSMAGAALALPGILAGVGTVIGATAIGFHGLGDALTDAVKAADELDPSLSALSATGQALVDTLVSLRPQWYALRNDVQTALLDGVDRSITYLAEQRLPMLAAGLAAVAAGVNTGMRGAMAALSTDEAGSSLDTLLRNSATAAQDLGNALAPMTLGLTNLFAIGSDYLPGLTQGLEGAGRAFLNWSRDGDAVRATIDQGIEVARQWGAALADVGAILGNIGRAALESGEGPAGMMELLDRIAAWSSSEEGYGALVSFFGAVRTAIDAATPVLFTFLEIIGRLAPHAADIIAAFAPFVDQVLEQLGTALERVAPLLPDLAAAFGEIAVEMAQLLPPLTNIAIAILPVLADLLEFIAPILPVIVAGFLGFKAAAIGFSVVSAAINGVTVAVRLMSAAWAANPLGVIIIVVAAVAGALVYAYNRFDWFRNAVDTVFRAIGAAATWLWDNAIRPAFDAIGAAAVWLWDNVLYPNFVAWQLIFRAVGAVASWLWTNAISPAFNGIAAIIAWAWNNIIRPTFMVFRAGLETVGAVASWLWRSVIVPVWNGIGASIRWVVDNVVSPAFATMRTAVGAVADSFTKAVDWIGQMWDRIKAIAARPVKFVVETVYNNGIRAVWNKVAGWLNLPELPEVGLGNLGSYARGTGAVLPGYTPGRDIYRFIDPKTGARINLSGGEGIAVPELVRAVGGPAAFQELNRQAMRSTGRAGGSGLDGDGRGGFAGGGVINSISGWIKKRFPGMTITSTFRPGDPGYHGKGLAVDASNGGNAGTPEMKALARALYNSYGSQLLELIHWPLSGWQNIKNGRPLDYGAATNAQHRNHVHVASSKPLDDLEPGAEGEGDGFFGSLFGFLRGQVANIADSILTPIGEKIGDFGGGLMGQVPKAAFDKMKDGVVGFLSGKADEQDATNGSVGLGEYGGNATFYLSEMIRAVKDMGMDRLAAYIAAATMLVETNLKMYANRSDPASLAFPHDAVGSDHDSSGLYQQRNNGAWGTIAERMNAYASSVLFLRALRKFNYAAMDPGAAAQRVQVSAFPGKYSQRMAEARRLVDPLFDSGGVATGTGLMMKDVIRPERVLSPRQTEAFDRLVDALTLSGSGTIDIGGLRISGSGSATLGRRDDTNAADRPGGTGATGNINATITIKADNADDAARQFAQRLTALIT